METPAGREGELGSALRFATMGLIALTVMVIIAALVVPTPVRKLVLPNDCKARADIVAIAAAVKNYAFENHGQLPDSLEALVQPDKDGHSFLELESVPLDPWKHPYRYELCAEAPGFRVSSLGADGALGGEGGDRDFDNIAIEKAR